ncbi:MAG: hypothetical protein ACFFBD_26490, partial [Candidatus Hodarchaeota archaeon]
MKYGVCLALFDEIKGPYVVYRHNVSESAALKIAIKTIISGGTLQTYDLYEADSISAVPEENLVTFFRYFAFKNKDDRASLTPASICFVAPLSEQLNVYRDAPHLSEIAINIVGKLKKVLQGLNELNIHKIEEVFNWLFSNRILSNLPSNLQDS